MFLPPQKVYLYPSYSSKHTQESLAPDEENRTRGEGGGAGGGGGYDSHIPDRSEAK